MILKLFIRLFFVIIFVVSNTILANDDFTVSKINISYDSNMNEDWYIRTEKNLRVVRKRVITGNKRVSGT